MFSAFSSYSTTFSDNDFFVFSIKGFNSVIALGSYLSSDLHPAIHKLFGSASLISFCRSFNFMLTKKLEKNLVPVLNLLKYQVMNTLELNKDGIC